MLGTKPNQNDIMNKFLESSQHLLATSLTRGLENLTVSLSRSKFG